MDAWLIQPARTLVVLAFAIGFPLWAVLAGQPQMPSETPPVGPSAPVTPNGRITSVDTSPPNPTRKRGRGVKRDPSLADASGYEEARPNPGGPAVNHEVQPPDRFTVIQRRLQDLGASYLLLESLGQPRTAYRFHCELDAPGSDRAGRLFEVTDANPLAAMEQVLTQVEDAHAVRLQLSDRLDRGPRF